ncbi:ATP-binding cassette domain-containing protein [Sphingomonas antarctica]|uniref:ATP-binding cassette domain-containing protein n=1 Tax=Sphingomonas antarctica TaxID=2040274 RepID=UPI0039EBDCAA
MTKFFGGVAALSGIDLTICPGEFVALVGGSGSGKSTLIRTINRLIDPDAGTATVAGAPDDVTELRRAIGYVIQDVGLFPHMTVGENIALGPRLAGRTIDPAEWLRLVDLPEDFIARLPATLSGGQQQRVGVARALATGAKLMLMDEPFGALDPVTRDALGQRVRKLHDDLALTTIMVTHDMAEALLLADRVIVLDKGKIAADGTPAQLLAGDGGEVAQALVAVPKRQAAALASKEAGPRLGGRGDESVSNQSSAVTPDLIRGPASSDHSD